GCCSVTECLVQKCCLMGSAAWVQNVSARADGFWSAGSDFNEMANCPFVFNVLRGVLGDGKQRNHFDLFQPIERTGHGFFPRLVQALPLRARELRAPGLAGAPVRS